VRSYGGYGAWGQPREHELVRLRSAQSCGIHGHDHASAWSSRLPVDDLKSFWGALGCACWAV